jgi:hypothetical protein
MSYYLNQIKYMESLLKTQDQKRLDAKNFAHCVDVNAIKIFMVTNLIINVNLTKFKDLEEILMSNLKKFVL